MTQEKAIMELMSNARQVGALETCILILEAWEGTKDLATPLKKREKEIEDKNEQLYDIAAGGKFNFEKAFRGDGSDAGE